MSRDREASNEFFMRAADVAGHNIGLAKRGAGVGQAWGTDFGLPGENDDV